MRLVANGHGVVVLIAASLLVLCAGDDMTQDDDAEDMSQMPALPVASVGVPVTARPDASVVAPVTAPTPSPTPSPAPAPAPAPEPAPEPVPEPEPAPAPAKATKQCMLDGCLDGSGKADLDCCAPKGEGKCLSGYSFSRAESCYDSGTPTTNTAYTTCCEALPVTTTPQQVSVTAAPSSIAVTIPTIPYQSSATEYAAGLKTKKNQKALAIGLGVATGVGALASIGAAVAAGFQHTVVATTLMMAAEEGDTRLRVMNETSFVAGTNIIIDAGTPIEETVQVASLDAAGALPTRRLDYRDVLYRAFHGATEQGTLVLTIGVKFAHQVGATVSQERSKLAGMLPGAVAPRNEAGGPPIASFKNKLEGDETGSSGDFSGSGSSSGSLANASTMSGFIIALLICCGCMLMSGLVYAILDRRAKRDYYNNQIVYPVGEEVYTNQMVYPAGGGLQVPPGFGYAQEEQGPLMGYRQGW